jgi:uncharacterized membrane protein YhaH (DUF805 family)
MKKIFSFPPLDPFKHPFNFSTRMSRVDFWLFYLCYILLASFSLGISEIMLQAIDPEKHTGVVVGLLLITPSLIWLLYLITALLSATARRMRDSGYRRSGLALSVALSLATMVAMFRDTLKAFEAGFSMADPTATLPYSEHTIWMALATGASLIYVFFGTVRKHRPEKKAE